MPPRINADKPRNIIVKFTSYNARKRVFEKKSNLRNARNRIFINGNLTKQRSEMYFETRKLAKAGKVKQTWTYDGRIFLPHNFDKDKETSNDMKTHLMSLLLPKLGLIM